MKGFNRALFAAGLLIAFFSCGLDSLFIHEIILEMPRRPLAWLSLGVLSYELRWIDEEGQERFALVAEDETVSLRLPRGGRAAIRALPLCGEAILDQAGSLYPFDVEEPENDMPSKKPDRMKLSFQSGYAVAVADALEAAGRDPWAYPIEKLAAIPEGIGRDPWTLPAWKTAQALIDGNFRLSLFPKPATEVRLPGDAEWWPESPYCLIERGDKGSVVTLPEGIHGFFSPSERLIVSVSDGKAIVQRIPFGERARLNPGN